jgi:exodeoxyribonuclease V alpha subunit
VDHGFRRLVNDRTHGQQFRARFLRTSPLTSADGIEKYLSSGKIRGVAPVYAKKLVRAFAEKVFDIIETTPDRLREIDGIGPVCAASILAAWAEQKSVREIMVFLHSHGVSTARAVRIFKYCGLPTNELAPLTEKLLDQGQYGTAAVPLLRPGIGSAKAYP